MELYILETRGSGATVKLNYFPELAKGVMRTYPSVPREWANVYPEKANYVPALGQHF